MKKGLYYEYMLRYFAITLVFFTFFLTNCKSI